MTVEELIEELKKYPPDMLVYGADYYADDEYPIRFSKIKRIDDILNGVLGNVVFLHYG